MVLYQRIIVFYLLGDGSKKLAAMLLEKKCNRLEP